MAYTNDPGAYTNEPGAYRDDPAAYGTGPRRVDATVAEYHDLVRWGPIFAGLVIAIATQLVLTGLGAAVGLTSIAGSDVAQNNAGDVGAAVGIWSIISLLIALFLGGWITARACGPMNRKTALLNGAILWATTLAVSALLLSSGVAGAFGLVAQGADAVANQLPVDALPNAAQAPNVTPEQAQNVAGNAAKVGWSFSLGSLLGLAAALGGAAAGARTPRAYGVTPR
ncbi:MAG TPA: hypothetical protein VLS96_12230 [Nodosilinea sp.]|nr:hypothetical protein [Nodosilinea sp.]